jgi:hypothetical protein
MRHRLSLASVVSAIVLVASASAHAGTLTNATWLQVTQGLPMTRTSAQLGAAGSGSTSLSIGVVTLSYPFFSTNFFVPKTPNGVLDLAIHVTQGGPQTITATPGMASGSPGIAGTVVVMTAAHIAMGLNQSMFMVGANTLVAVPLSAGKAGQFTNTFSVTGQLHIITVDFYAWTPGTLTFTGLTTKGGALPTVIAMGSFNLNAQGGGTVTLVSPSKVSIDGALAQRRTASFTTLVLSFIPEPGTLLLLGAGAVALTFAGRSRRR